VAAVIERGGRFLLCRRPVGKRHAGLWEFPGGKFLPAVADPGSPFVVEFHRAAIAGDPRPLEHDELAWVAPGDLASYALAPSDRAFVEWVRGVE
jgi:8-oxo-dGTP diphosphatase